jgi:endonuclease/exonuclease/phosphatase family metal-dependent hydrolase
VFYRKSKLEPLSTNHFWLSDTPEVPASSSWGNSNKRMVTWIKFRERSSGVEFYFLNTHFDHQVQLAREKSAELVRTRITALGTNLPIILSGDFNADAKKNRAYSILTQNGFLTDAWLSSPIRKNEGLGTFNGFRAMPMNGERIDWILTRGAVKVQSAEIVALKPRDEWASDHLPVTVRVTIENP